MTMWIAVARYQMVRPGRYLALLAVLAFAMGLSFLTYALNGPGTRYTGLLGAVFFYFFVLGIQSIGTWMPFGLTLGASRRSLYSGTALLGVSAAAVLGLVIAVLQAIERATGGWGLSIHFFRVPYLLDGPWYATWLTSCVGLSAVYIYGMWYGVVHRRWGSLGTVVFIAAQALVVVAAVVLGRGHGWSVLGGFFGLTARNLTAHGVTALGLTGIVAALAAVLLAGGYATIRRVAV